MRKERHGRVTEDKYSCVRVVILLFLKGCMVALFLSQPLPVCEYAILGSVEMTWCQNVNGMPGFGFNIF